MKEKTVIKRTSIGSTLPLVLLGFLAFIMYYFGVSLFWWGIYCVFLALIIAAFAVAMATENSVELFDENGKIRKDLLP